MIATSFGLGYIPVAPGTFGALGGLILSSLCMKLGLHYYTYHFVHLTSVLLCFALGTYACKYLSEIWGHDPSRVVIDETLGFWVSILFLPINLYTLAGGFILFRLFDILKPLGIKKIDQSGSVYSVMLDDVVAGIYANITLQVAYFVIST